MAKTKAVESARQDYGVTNTEFAEAWATSESADEVVEKLEELAKSKKQPPMPKPIVLARAAGLRSQGVKLQKFRPGRRPNTEGVDEMNALVAKLRSEQGSDPETDDLVDRVIKEIVRRLSR